MEKQQFVVKARELMRDLPYIINKKIYDPQQHPGHIDKMLQNFKMNVPKEDILFFIDATDWDSAEAGTLFTTSEIFSVDSVDCIDTFRYDEISTRIKHLSILYSEMYVKEHKFSDRQAEMELRLPLLVDVTIQEKSASATLFERLEQVIELGRQYVKLHKPNNQTVVKDTASKEQEVKKAEINLDLSKQIREKPEPIVKPSQVQPKVKVIEKPALREVQPVEVVKEKTFAQKIYSQFNISKAPLQIHENIYYYAHAEKNPKTSKKFTNVLQSYASEAMSNNERPILIVDNTAFGSAKDGLLLTEKAMYWHNIFSSSKRISYEEVTEIELKKTDIIVNGNEIQLTLLGKKATAEFAKVLNQALLNKLFI